MRNIPVELVTRYEEAGWWTRETLGQVLAGGLHAAPDAEFRVYSQVRPWSGTFHDEQVAAPSREYSSTPTKLLRLYFSPIYVLALTKSAW
jgi:hypothetical protein